MGITLVQATAQYENSANNDLYPQTIAIPATGAGHYLIVALGWYSGCFSPLADPDPTITDDTGDIFAAVPGARGACNAQDGQASNIFWAQNIAGGAVLITINGGPSDVVPNVIVWEIAADSPLVVDVSGYVSQPPSNTDPSINGTVLAGTGATDFYVACTTFDNQVIALASPWTLRQTTPFGNMASGHLLSSGTRQAVFTQNNVAGTYGYAISSAAFKEASAVVTAPQMMVFAVSK